MLNISEAKWYRIDNETEETIIDNVKFTRPIGYKPVDICCSFCKKLVASIEDVEKMKEANVCNVCYDLYYYHNKEKWKNGWRPNIIK